MIDSKKREIKNQSGKGGMGRRKGKGKERKREGKNASKSTKINAFSGILVKQGQLRAEADRFSVPKNMRLCFVTGLASSLVGRYRTRG